MRRFFIAVASALCLLPPLVVAQRVLTFDWTVAETLVALGHPPAGVAQISDYHSWIGAPRLPDATLDLGLRNQPALELMAELEPDLLLITPMFAHMAEQLRTIGPVQTLPLYEADKDGWDSILEMTRRLGTLTQKESTARTLIERTDRILTHIRKQVRGCGPLLVMQLVDERHVRVYGGNSLYQHVLDRLGIDNAWTGAVNQWGYRLLGLHELAGVTGHALIIQPSPLGTLERMEQHALWRALPVFSEHAPVVLPPIWSMGGLPSAQRFAQWLAQTGCRP
ncbi:MAG TPA: ABC transporter substrate-binding protein [Alcaligenes sp.]|nr:ABC transporter substrate-binding protein [Alcaligenes faecalis]HRL20305.1 ABC transporter substrate-binding protein [Alcaligenes sp.]